MIDINSYIIDIINYIEIKLMMDGCFNLSYPGKTFKSSCPNDERHISNFNRLKTFPVPKLSTLSQEHLFLTSTLTNVASTPLTIPIITKKNEKKS